jgi:hypothetical protein
MPLTRNMETGTCSLRKAVRNWSCKFCPFLFTVFLDNDGICQCTAVGNDGYDQFRLTMYHMVSRSRLTLLPASNSSFPHCRTARTLLGKSGIYQFQQNVEQTVLNPLTVQHLFISSMLCTATVHEGIGKSFGYHFDERLIHKDNNRL